MRRRLNGGTSTAAQKAIAAVPSVEGLGGAHAQTFDVIGAAPGVGEGAIALLAVREGRLLSIKVVIAGCDDNSGEMVTAFIEQYYQDDAVIPERIIINTKLQDQETLTIWLSEKAGHRVEMYTPQRDMARIARQADQNAQAHLTAYSTHQRENEALLEKLKQFLIWRLFQDALKRWISPTWVIKVGYRNPCHLQFVHAARRCGGHPPAWRRAV